MNKTMSAYFHIPFCISKCQYCDFVSFPESQHLFESYVNALCQEIIQTALTERDNSRSIDLNTIYFGGGTPSILPPLMFKTIMHSIFQVFSVLPEAEITLEVNPGSISDNNIKILCATVVNRVSIGVQSLCDDELILLGRAHSSNDAMHTIKQFKQFGVENISCDVMIGLPGQTLEMAMSTVEKLVQMEVPHISVYSLSIEPHTPFEEKYGKSIETLMPQQLERRIYWMIRNYLRSEGYRHYEISNYAKPGFESRHNTSYWTGQEYYGIGCAAHGFLDRLRYSNTMDINKYIDAAKTPDKMIDIIRKTEEFIDNKNAMKEFFLLGLRMLDGVCNKDFVDQFGPMPIEYKKKLKKLVISGLIIEKNGYYKLSRKGLDFANNVFREFI